LIEFSIEVDNSDDKELFTTKRVRLEALMHVKVLQFSLLDGTGNEPQAISLSDNTDEDDEDDEENYDFADNGFENIMVYDNGQIRVAFGGLVVDSEKVYIKIWSKNVSNKIYKIWLKEIVVDGERISGYEKIGTCIPSGSWNSNNVLAKNVDVYDYYDIEFTVEIDDNNNKALGTSKRVKVHVDFPDKEIKAILCEPVNDEEYDDDDSVNIDVDDNDDEDNYDFADDDFEDIMIYDNGQIRVDFGGLVVDNEKVYIKIWSKNISNKIYKIWLREIVVDGERISGYEKVGTCIPSGSWNSNNVLAKNVDVYDYYDIEFTAEIDDSNNKALDTSKRVKVHVDFPDREIKAVLSESVNDEEDDGEEAGDSDPLFVENSFCMRNNEHNGLEIYFPDIPESFIRAAMKEQGWRWHKSKGCWYARDNNERRILAKKITGKEVQG